MEVTAPKACGLLWDASLQRSGYLCRVERVQLSMNVMVLIVMYYFDHYFVVVQFVC